MDFIDLKTQYRALKASIDARIQKVLDHGQYVVGPEVAELEQRLATYVGAKHGVAHGHVGPRRITAPPSASQSASHT